MQCNMYLLMSCNRRKRLWLTHVPNSVKREVLRATVRAKNTKSGKHSMMNKNDLKSTTNSSTVSFVKNTLLEEVGDPVSHTKNNERCLRCGRKLKNPTAKMLGYGPICYAKIQSENQHKLF